MIVCVTPIVPNEAREININFWKPRQKIGNDLDDEENFHRSDVRPPRSSRSVLTWCADQDDATLIKRASVLELPESAA